MAQERSVTVNGVPIFVADSGEDWLPPVVCLHSLWFDQTMFDRFAVEAKGRFRVIRPDFRGQGRSGRAASGVISIETCAGDVAALLDAFELKRVDLVCQSMGGDVAWHLILEAPERFRSLTIMGSSARAEPADQRAWAMNWVEEARTHGIDDDNVEFLMRAMFGVSTLENPEKQGVVRHWRAFMRHVGISALDAMEGVIDRSAMVDRLAEITTPSLVISGVQDLVRPAAWSVEVSSLLPNASLMRVSHCGHSPMLEKPDIVIPAIFSHIEAINTA